MRIKISRVVFFSFFGPCAGKFLELVNGEIFFFFLRPFLHIKRSISAQYSSPTPTEISQAPSMSSLSYHHILRTLFSDQMQWRRRLKGLI